MSISSSKFLSVLQTRPTETETGVKAAVDYPYMLEKIRGIIAQHHADELSKSFGSRESADTLKELILRYCLQEMAGKEYDAGKLADQIFLDMASLGILTEYLRDPMVEEININSYNLIEIIYSDHIKYLRDEEAFRTPQAALDTIKRMVRVGGSILDGATPRVDSYIGDGTRITATIKPVVPDENGVVASIRKQNKSSITRENLIDSGSVSPEILDFLTMCICNHISIGIAGSTGSGKTTDLAFLLNEYIRRNHDYNNRIYIIEDSRELNLLDYDDENDRPARVIYTTTKAPPNPITMLDLIIDSLRYHPNLLVPAEVRDAAAYEAAVAGQTGHTIVTTLHADNARDAYKRLLSMCNMAQTGLSESKLMDMCVSAWPIMVYKKQLRDNSRKYMEVFEATGQKDGEVVGHMLFSFEIEGAERDERGNISKVIGKHVRTGCISPRLYKRLRDNGVEESEIRALFPDAVAPAEEGVA